MSKQIRIGTRKSPLAQWQAYFIKDKILQLGYDVEIVLVESSGDQDLISPLYELGVQGIFTKTLDLALINNKVDIAVHSLKDVPTMFPKGLKLAAVPQRANAQDLLVHKEDIDYNSTHTIATSSLRRKAQWLHKYPHHRLENIRGNVNRRLEKLENNTEWSGAIFAQIGLQRLDIQPRNTTVLDWMVPSPAQGALGVVCRQDDVEIESLCKKLDHQNSNRAVAIERLILRHCFGGCTLPLGAFVSIENEQIKVLTNITSLDGKQMVKIQESVAFADPRIIAENIAKKLLSQGGQEILDTINASKND